MLHSGRGTPDLVIDDFIRSIFLYVNFIPRSLHFENITFTIEEVIDEYKKTKKHPISLLNKTKSNPILEKLE